MKITTRRKIALRPEATHNLKISLGIFQKKGVALKESIYILDEHCRKLFSFMDEFSARLRMLKTFSDAEQLNHMEDLFQHLNNLLKNLPVLANQLNPIMLQLAQSRDDMFNAVTDLKLIIQDNNER